MRTLTKQQRVALAAAIDYANGMAATLSTFALETYAGQAVEDYNERGDGDSESLRSIFDHARLKYSCLGNRLEEIEQDLAAIEREAVTC